MYKVSRQLDYPVELETQFIMRLPPEAAGPLREALRSGDNLKNRLSIQINNDARQGQVRFDHRVMHGKILDLPTIVESLKTIDSKRFYKTADISQIMVCKDEPDVSSTEDESPVKKKKDGFKVDKKYLWPHGITPPTKNVRKRRFRKTLRKKSAEAPEVEKEVKQLLRADNEACSVKWEIIEEVAEAKPEQSLLPIVKQKAKTEPGPKQPASNEVDIFGGTLSDSDLDDDNEIEASSAYDSRMSDTNSFLITDEMKAPSENLLTQFSSSMFPSSQSVNMPIKRETSPTTPGISSLVKTNTQTSDEDNECQIQGEDMNLRIEQLKKELDKMKERRQRIQNEMVGMENMTLHQRFQDVLHALNQDIMYKEMEYQGLITFQNSEYI